MQYFAAARAKRCSRFPRQSGACLHMCFAAHVHVHVHMELELHAALSS